MPTMATRATTPVWRPASWTLARGTIVVALLLPVFALPAFLGPQILFVPEVAPFLALFVALAIANAMTRNRWVQLAGGLVAAAFAALNFAFIYAELGRPDHYPVFFIGWLVVVGGAAGLVGGIAGFVDARRGLFGTPRWAGFGATLVLLAAGFLVGTLVATAGMRFSETPAPADVALTPDATLDVGLADFAFAPEDVQIPANQIVLLRLSNTDPEPHTFTVDALGIDVEVASGKTAEVWLEAPAGTYPVYCRPHSDVSGDEPEGMVGTLTAS